MAEEASIISAKSDVVSILNVVNDKYSSISQPGEAITSPTVVVAVDGFGILDNSEDSLNDPQMVFRYTFKNMNRMTVQVYKFNVSTKPLIIHDMSTGHHVWCDNNKHKSS